MNLEQSDSFKDEIEKNTKRRKGVMLSIVLCACLIAFLFIIIMILKYQDSITEKLFLDDKQIAIPSGLYKDIEGTTYINLKEIASILGYSYTKGEYNKFNENEDSAYLENDFETVAVSAEKTKYEKYLKTIGEELTIADIPVLMKSDPDYYEVFEIEKPIKFVDNNLYVSLDSLGDMFNIQISWTQYRKKIYSLEYIVNKSKSVIAKLEYNQISGYYENLRALLYGYAIVGNGTTGEDGKEYTATTDKDGKVEFNDLIWQKYTLVETKTIAGFELSQKSYTFDVGYGDEIEYTIKNVRRTELPVTGGNGSMIFLAIGTGLILISFGIIIVSEIKKKTKENK